MKYIKTFENTDIKRYIIFYWDEKNSLEILELKDIQKYKYMYETYELYSYKDDKLTKEKGETFAVMKDDNDQILYQSDSLEDCIKVIPFIYNTNKYDL